MADFGEDEAVKPSGAYIEAAEHEHIFKTHALPESIVDLGEIRMNYAVAGSPSSPALLLIPGQTESWWSYESAMQLLAESYQVYAVDLRGQGRSTWTPGRYTLDLFGNDLVRFIDRVIKRPTIVSGLSSGGVISAWLSAYATPGQIIAAVYEDPPLFASEINPAIGHSIRQTVAGPMFRIWYKWLGPQQSINNEEGMIKAMPTEMPSWIPAAIGAAVEEGKPLPVGTIPEIHEYDPEWGYAFFTGSVAQSCDHASMLQHVKVPVLFTHHFRRIDPQSGNLIGASSDLQVQNVKRLVESTGNTFTYRSFPDQPHSMHSHDPITFVTTITEWFATLGLGATLHPTPDQLPSKPASKVESSGDNANQIQSDMATLKVSAAQPTSEPTSPGSSGIDGEWQVSLNTPVGKDHVKLTFTSSGTSLGGSISGDKGTFKIENGHIQGSTVTFQAQSPMKMKVQYKANFEVNTISGKAKAALFPALSFVGTRIMKI